MKRKDMSNKRSLICQYLVFMSLFLAIVNISAATWRVETIDSTGNVGEYTSIAVDSKDNIHISYNDGTNDDLKYATNTSDTWTTETVDSSGVYLHSSRLNRYSTHRILSGLSG